MDNRQKETVELNINGKKAREELENLKKSAEKFREAMEKAAKEKGVDSKEFKKAQREFDKTNKQIHAMQSNLVNVNHVMHHLDTATPKELRRTITSLTKVLSSPNLRRGSEEWNTYTRMLRQAKAELSKIKAETSASGNGGFLSGLFGGGSGFMNGIVGTFSKLAGVVGVGVGALTSFVSISRQAIQVNKEFEQANANLASILGTTRNDIKELTADAKRLGASTQYTASQVTALQTELAKLGFTKAEILSSTEAVLNFATATGAGLADAASVAGAALRAFGLDASEMDRVASVMSVATTKSAMSFSTLQTSIGIVAPVAKQFGFSIEDTVALLGKLSDAGFDASSAATAVRNIFLYMSDPASKLSTALGGPIKSLDDLAPAFQKLTDRGIDLAEMLELTDKRAVSAFATLVSQGNGLTQLRDDITDCGDALKAMVDERMNTLEGSTKKLESAWEGLLLTFSNSTGVMKSVVDWLAKMVDGLHEFFASADENSNNRVSDRVRQLRDEKAWMAQYTQLRRELMEDEAMSEIEAEKEVSRQMREEYNKRSKEAAAVKARLDAINKRKDAGYGTYEENGQIYNFYEMNALQSQLEERLSILQNYADRASYIMNKAEKAVGQDNTNTSGGGGGGGNKTNNALAAQAKAREAQQLSALEAEYQQQREAYKNNEEELQRIAEEYADKRYGIERGTLEEIRDIYKDKPQQYAQYNKQIFDLEAKHQRDLAKLRSDGAKAQAREDKEHEREAERARKAELAAERASKKEKERLDKEMQRQSSSLASALPDYNSSRANIDAKKMELREMLTAYQEYYRDLLTSDKLTDEQRAAIYQEYVEKVRQMNSMISGWEQVESEQKVKDVANRTQKMLSVMSSVLNTIGDSISANYDNQIADVERRYDAEIAAAEKAGKDTTAIEKAKDAEVNALRKKQAQAQMKIDIAQGLLNTAMSISQTLAQYGTTPWGIAMAAIAATMGAVQVATITQQARAKIAGYYDGGYTGGNKYRREAGVVHEGEFVANHEAVQNPNVRPVLDFIDQAQRRNSVASITSNDIALAAGYYDGGYTGGHKYRRETGVVHEGEFVANHEAVQNPNVRPVLYFIDQAQRLNSVASITSNDIALAAAHQNGFLQGGYTSTPPVINVSPAPVSVANQQELIDVIRLLNAQLADGISAEVAITGRKGIRHQEERYNQLLNNKNRS